MKQPVFTGAAVAIITPMHADGTVNVEELGRIIDDQIAHGTDAIVICGTTGESAALSHEEHVECIRFAVKHTAKRVPVIAGTGSNDTAFAIRSAKQAKNLGADALLLVTPYYNKTSQQGLIRHFTAIADATDLPIILYNIPGRTGLNMQPSTLRELSKHENIVGVKEASGNLEQITEVAYTCPELALYSGNDDQVIPMLALGGRGVISVASNLMPRKVHDMVRLWMEGDQAASRALQFELYPLIKALFCEVNPIPVKTALNDMGFDCGGLRLPLIEMQENNHARLREEMKKMGLL